MDTEGDTIVDSVSETPGAQEVIHNTSTDENNDDWGDEISDTGIAFSVSYEAEDARIGRVICQMVGRRLQSWGWIREGDGELWSTLQTIRRSKNKEDYYFELEVLIESAWTTQLRDRRGIFEDRPHRMLLHMFQMPIESYSVSWSLKREGFGIVKFLMTWWIRCFNQWASVGCVGGRNDVYITAFEQAQTALLSGLSELHQNLGCTTQQPPEGAVWCGHCARCHYRSELQKQIDLRNWE